VDEKTLGTHKVLPFSSAKDTSAIADSLLKQLKEWKGQDTGVDRKLAELQSLLLKSELLRVSALRDKLTPCSGHEVWSARAIRKGTGRPVFRQNYRGHSTQHTAGVGSGADH
jgi:hypothetical protein